LITVAIDLGGFDGGDVQEFNHSQLELMRQVIVGSKAVEVRMDEVCGTRLK
jgi:hypothetical protein